MPNLPLSFPSYVASSIHTSLTHSLTVRQTAQRCARLQRRPVIREASEDTGDSEHPSCEFRARERGLCVSVGVVEKIDRRMCGQGLATLNEAAADERARYFGFRTFVTHSIHSTETLIT